MNYKNLSLAVIDEQHRFGVNQRVKITEKGNNVNILVMTATPIPRSLALTAYGDMNISTITEKPKGRKPIKTYVLPQSKIEDVLKSIKRAIANEALIYWVCPLIEESESTDLIAVNERFDYLKNYFKDCNISLVHGKQDKIDSNPRHGAVEERRDRGRHRDGQGHQTRWRTGLSATSHSRWRPALLPSHRARWN